MNVFFINNSSERTNYELSHILKFEVLATALLFILLYGVFRVIEYQKEMESVSVVTTIFRNETYSIHPYDMGKGLTDLKMMGIINCPKLIEKGDEGRVYIDFSHAEECKGKRRIETLVPGVSGMDYQVSYTIARPWESRALELLTYLLLTLGLFLYRLKKIHIQKLNSAVLNEQQKAHQKNFELAERLAHDIRSPVAALKTASMNEKIRDPEVGKMVEMALERLNQISESFLEKTRAERDSILKKINRETESSATSESIQDLNAAIKSLIVEKRAVLKQQHQAPLDLSIRIDFQLFEQNDGFIKMPIVEVIRIISNLINNSIEAINQRTDEHAPKLQGEIQVRSLVSIANNKCFLQIEVIDNGPGIPDSIFELLGHKKGISTKMHNSHSGEVPVGNGLGIYTAQSVLQSYGGKLVIMKPKIGAQILMEVPIEIIPR